MEKVILDPVTESINAEFGDIDIREEYSKLNKKYEQNKKKENDRRQILFFKVIIALNLIVVVMLFIACWIDMQYGYYQALRIVVSSLMLLLAFINKSEGNSSLLTYCIIVAVVFNPIFPVELQKQSWNEVDGTTALITLCTATFYWMEMEEYKKSIQ